MSLSARFNESSDDVVLDETSIMPNLEKDKFTKDAYSKMNHLLKKRETMRYESKRNKYSFWDLDR